MSHPTRNIVVGTPEYMAPEQARVQPISRELVVELLMMHLEQAPERPSAYEPMVSGATGPGPGLARAPRRSVTSDLIKRR